MAETPRHLLPTRLADGEDYPSVDELMALGGLVACTVRVPFWRRADGADVPVRVSGLDLPTQEAIRLQAARAVKKEDRERGVRQHGPTFAAATLAAALAAPRLTFEQAMALVRGRHAAGVELLVNFIWAISAVDQETVDAIVAAEAEAELAAEAPADELDAGEPADDAA